MIRLHAVVEGQTEEAFVRMVLAPELGARGMIVIDARRVATARTRLVTHKGGVPAYVYLKNDLVRWMKQDQRPDAWFTTMVDFYGLPTDFPNYADCLKHAEPTRRVECLEEGFNRDLSHRRFIPYIQLHEFEALLFSDVAKFEVEFPKEVVEIETLAAIRRQFSDPEHIDNRPEHAPSKRILSVLPAYTKVVAGPPILQQIGLAKLRHECPHFHQWISRIENVALTA